MLGLISGCTYSAPRPPAKGPKLTFIIQPGSDLAQAQFPVDVFLVGAKTIKQVEAVKVDDYFLQAENPVRHLVSNPDPNIYKAFSFSPNSAQSVTFSLTDTTRYPHYTHLVVIARIPAEISAGGPDPRRLFLPLGREHWSPNTRLVNLTITSGGISPNPEPVENL